MDEARGERSPLEIGLFGVGPSSLLFYQGPHPQAHKAHLYTFRFRDRFIGALFDHVRTPALYKSRDSTHAIYGPWDDDIRKGILPIGKYRDFLIDTDTVHAFSTADCFSPIPGL